MIETVSLEITLSEPWISPNKWDRLARSPAAKFAKQKQMKMVWAAQIREQWEAMGFLPLINVEINAFRIANGSFDDDNLKGGLKPIIDCMKLMSKSNPHGCGVIVEDRRKILKKLECHEMKPKKDEGESSLFIITGQEVSKAFMQKLMEKS